MCSQESGKAIYFFGRWFSFLQITLWYPRNLSHQTLFRAQFKASWRTYSSRFLSSAQLRFEPARPPCKCGSWINTFRRGRRCRSVVTRLFRKEERSRRHQRCTGGQNRRSRPNNSPVVAPKHHLSVCGGAHTILQNLMLSRRPVSATRLPLVNCIRIQYIGIWFELNHRLASATV